MERINLRVMLNNKASMEAVSKAEGAWQTKILSKIVIRIISGAKGTHSIQPLQPYRFSDDTSTTSFTLSRSCSPRYRKSTQINSLSSLRHLKGIPN